MTEEEAKQCWCPFVRYKSAQGEGINRWIEDYDEAIVPLPARCCASRCMAWRWHIDEHYDPQSGNTTYEQSDSGYCGLAGAPQR
jgi:hypothetical protein